MTKKVAVLYHGNCPDGFGGAWAAWKKFGSKADYFPVRYNFPPPRISNAEVFMIDFCYNEPEFMELLKKNNKSLTVIDHHKTAKKNFRMASGGVLDMNHSGAVLAWKYFHRGKPVPLFLKYIEDMDLWKFKLANTKLIAPLMDVAPMDFKTWNKLIKEFENASSRKKYMGKGKILLEHQNMLMLEVVSKALQKVKFHGHKTYAVNTPLFDSEIGAYLYEKLPPMSIIWYENQDGIKVSLRSNGKVDVGNLAEKYGGGGHRGAAGFRIKKGAKIPWKPFKK